MNYQKKGLLIQFFVVSLVGYAIYVGEGISGFKPLLSIEAVLLVFGGTFLLTWAVYPLEKIIEQTDSKVCLYAANSAVSMGALTTIIGVILVLASITDVQHVPSRMAMALSGLFWGLILSEIILIPLSERLARQAGDECKSPTSWGKRAFLAFLTTGIVVFLTMVALFVISTNLHSA